MNTYFISMYFYEVQNISQCKFKVSSPFNIPDSKVPISICFGIEGQGHGSFSRLCQVFLKIVILLHKQALTTYFNRTTLQMFHSFTIAPSASSKIHIHGKQISQLVSQGFYTRRGNFYLGLYKTLRNILCIQKNLNLNDPKEPLSNPKKF